ncbi:acylneuraminate cytidylyltransferase family protein [Candidatus Parcubacteria bacterium]|nr:acylneuraminate cytidylyltransferase family protein [Candidatus Parcubacteria bacterium]
MNKNNKILAIIPARSGSKRIPGKNIKNFLGKPLIARAIEQALNTECIDRVIVDTNSEKIAAVAKKYKADVPFLRPSHLAQDDTNVIDSLFYVLDKLKKNESYIPTHLMILQTTSPLRDREDIEKCWELMQKTDATTALTVCPTHPKLYHLSPDNDIILVNGSEAKSNNTQTWEPAYLLNGCFVYIVELKALYKEKRIITKKTKAIVCPKWRSVDLDMPEEWVMAEIFYKNKDEIKKRIKKIEEKKL